MARYGTTMNEEAAREREANKSFIKSYEGQTVDGVKTKILEVDGSKATFHGAKVNSLTEFLHRKFDNLLFLSEAPQRVEIHYVNRHA